MTTPDTPDSIDVALRAHRAGQLAEAEAVYRRILERTPDHPEALHLLGLVAHQVGRHDDALDLMTRSLSLAPDSPGTLINLGGVLRALQRREEAVAHLRAAIALEPRIPDAHNTLGLTLHETGLIAEAVACFHAAIALRPDFPEAHANLGNALKALGRLDEAIGAFGRAIALRPDHPAAHNNLGNALRDCGRAAEAVASYRRALEYGENVSVWNNLGNVLKELGSMAEAVAAYRSALALAPDDVDVRSNLLVTLPFMDTAGGAEVFAEARLAGAVMEAAVADRPPRRHANRPEPERRLRVGYLSPSLAAHVLAPHVEPVFAAHRRDRVEVHVYAHVPHPDAVTWRLKELADAWTFVHTLSDEEVEARIIADGIDILVDPMGYWAHNRLPVFARRPAPIQVAYLCQGPTSGLTAMDYAIGDPWINQGDAMQRFATERVVELAGGFQVTSFDTAPPIVDGPLATSGIVTFGSFNNPAKISDTTLRLWSAVLARLPTARLLIKGKWLDRPDNHGLLVRRLAEHGIAVERTTILGFIPGPSHLEAHHLVDIALDTVPFTGGRTTEDALWMGVPVVTLVGDTVSGRLSHNHLCRIGAPELVAATAEEYVDIAVALAGDAARLRHYRQTLRPAMQRSSLMDAPAHVAELEEAFRTMWRRWCAGLGPATFAVRRSSGDKRQ
ncbi:MAG: tetratricopeptide repeat protein [Alphaproteobacteria bacterium]